MGASRRHVLLAVVLVLGSLLAIGAGHAALQAGSHAAQEGGIFRIGLNSVLRLDSLDPPSRRARRAGRCSTRRARGSWPIRTRRRRPAFACNRRLPPASRRSRATARHTRSRLRSGFRFSDGKPVRASAFARAINRAARARDELAGRALRPGHRRRRARARGQGDDALAASSRAGTRSSSGSHVRRPTSHIERRRRSSAPCRRRCRSIPKGVGAFPAAGPYFVAEYRRGERVVLRQNRFYGGQAAAPRRRLRRRPSRRVAAGSAAASRARRSRLGPHALGHLLRSRARTRRQVRDQSLAALRQARSHTADARVQLVTAALPQQPGPAQGRQLRAGPAGPREPAGRSSAAPSDQYLPSIMPGFKDADVYPLERPDLQRARALANGNLRGGKAILYVNSSPLPMAIGQLVRQQLAEIGLDVEVQASRSTARPPRTSTSSRPRASHGTSPSASGARATSTPSRTSTCSSTGGSSARTNFTRFALGP